METTLLLAVLLGIAVLFLLILGFKLPAFISLLISSIVVGITAGMDPASIINSMTKGMGGTLGFVAVVVGLGAMFGAILEKSGGAYALANGIIERFGVAKAPWALMLIGFIIAIPVFFDVAFIIMIPMLYSLQKKSGKSLLLFAIPLLASLAIAHAFIPPTPGPIAVADILKADLGMIILLGITVGLPTAIICGPIFGKWIANKIHIEAPFQEETELTYSKLPALSSILAIIATPILLIVIQTLIKQSPAVQEELPRLLLQLFELIGHPFIALIIANLLAWVVLGLGQGFSSKSLLKLSNKSLEMAGTIILLTGAGGVFKEILIDTGAGEMLANLVVDAKIALLPIAFATAVLIRLLQGSATVAMITAAGLVAPLVSPELSPWQLSLIVLAVASGASTTSHVNDSGFWLVGQYLGLNETQTLRSWTLMTALLSVISFSLILVLSLFI
ncbi:MAG: GntP family permease [Saprospiraceae bacterium]|nr:GntP family permease [Saprospiraceae bacterium]